MHAALVDERGLFLCYTESMRVKLRNPAGHIISVDKDKVEEKLKQGWARLEETKEEPQYNHRKMSANNYKTR